MNKETIVAIATPPGRGGVVIIRLSGPFSYTIALKLSKKTKVTPRLASFSTFYTHLDECLDQGIILYFKAPHSFTGEDVIEFQIHGSPIVADRMMSECVFWGARLARPGEFSERAFLNDKMDLTQAEAIADLIQASSESAARMAVRSLQGDFSKKIDELNQKIIHLRMYVEAAIDFPEEEIDFLNDGHVAQKLKEISDNLSSIRNNVNQGMMMQEGLSVVIAGRPNAGKSTLINQLSAREVAIVTAIAGTTRDVMREQILLDDIPLHLVDTAGLRVSDDLVEQEGIKRAWDEVRRADCLLLVTDLTQRDIDLELSEAIEAALPANVPVITVFNKIDEVALHPQSVGTQIYLSAKLGTGVDFLKDKIKEIVGYQPTEGQFLARRRHIEAINKAMDLITAGQQQLILHRAGELLAEDLNLAHQALAEITGKFSSDDLLGEIFSSFCIGK